MLENEIEGHIQEPALNVTEADSNRINNDFEKKVILKNTVHYFFSINIYTYTSIYYLHTF